LIAFLLITSHGTDRKCRIDITGLWTNYKPNNKSKIVNN